MTVREEIEEAYSFYDKGEWNKSLKILSGISGFAKEKPTRSELAEIVSLQGWNNWKKGEKEEAYLFWSNIVCICPNEATDIIKASVHAGLGIYYAEEGNKKEALEHAHLAQDFLPEDATANQNKNLNACGITMAKIGKLDKAEEILKKVAKINEQLMKSDDPEIAKEATHQLGKNFYNLATLVHIPQEKFHDALYYLARAEGYYSLVGAETDEAASKHRCSEIYEKMGNFKEGLRFEEMSLALWEKHKEDAPGRVKTSLENIERIKNKMRRQE